MAGGPIIAIIGDGRDRLVRADLADRLLQALDEPVLRGDRAGIAGRPMLVVEHQEEPVRDPGEGGEVPVGIAHRHRGGDDPAALAEAPVGGVEEAQIIGQGFPRQILEVEGDAGAVAQLDQALAGLEQAGRGGGIVKQRREVGSVPLTAQRILHHRDHGRPVRGAVHDRVEARIRVSDEPVVRAGDRGGGGHDPIHLADMGGEGGGAGIVPWHVEAGDELMAVMRGERMLGQPGMMDEAETAVRRRDPIGQRMQPCLFHAQRQGRRHWHVEDGEGEGGHGGDHDQHEDNERPPRPPPAAARRIVKDRLVHANRPETWRRSRPRKLARR